MAATLTSLASLQTAMADQLQDKDRSGDYTLVCGGQQIKAHSFILISRLASTLTLTILQVAIF